jgi:hypothetical protein
MDFREFVGSGWCPVAPPSVLPTVSQDAISPTRGEIRLRVWIRQPATLAIGETLSDSAISPPVGEMSGRTEGGAVEHHVLPDTLQ